MRRAISRRLLGVDWVNGDDGGDLGGRGLALAHDVASDSLAITISVNGRMAEI